MKYIIIFLILSYLFIKFTGFIMKVMFRMLGGTTNTEKYTKSKKYSPFKKRPNGSNVDIDYVPHENSNGNKHHYKGGEYVEYEEVK